MDGGFIAREEKRAVLEVQEGGTVLRDFSVGFEEEQLGRVLVGEHLRVLGVEAQLGFAEKNRVQRGYSFFELRHSLTLVKIIIK